MKTELEVQRIARHEDIPPDEDFQSWTDLTLAGRGGGNSLTIRIVEQAESRRLNSGYRGIDAATNVLSFTADLPEEVTVALRDEGGALPLGDLVICAEVVLAEAAAQGKPVRHHWTHLVIHGILHLLGYGHSGRDEARVMESLERELLAGMGIPDPYQAR